MKHTHFQWQSHGMSVQNDVVMTRTRAASMLKAWRNQPFVLQCLKRTPQTRIYSVSVPGHRNEPEKMIIHTA